MRARRLLVLAVVFAALISAVLLQRAYQRRHAAEEKRAVAQPARVLNSDLAAAFVQTIELSKAGDASQTVILRKDPQRPADSQTGGWIIESRFGAGARLSMIDPLLKRLSDIKGEPVADSPEVLKDYQIAETQAFRVRLANADGKTLSELWISPLRPGGTRNFVRAAGTTQVIATDTDLLDRLNIYKKDDKIKPGDFTDYRLIIMNTARIQRIELTGDKSGALSLLKTEKTPDKPETWRLGEGESAPQLDTDKVNALANGVNNLYGQEVLDPAGTEYALSEKPWIRFTLSSDEKPGEWSLFLGRHSDDKKTTVVKVMPGGMVYEVADRYLEPHLKKDKGTFLKA